MSSVNSIDALAVGFHDTQRTGTQISPTTHFLTASLALGACRSDKPADHNSSSSVCAASHN
jgi:hypothetical protein